MDNHTRLFRLNKLLDVVRLHVGQRRKPVQIAPGIKRAWDMEIWDCGTSACALGNYVLSDYGSRYWVFSRGLGSAVKPRLRNCISGVDIFRSATQHAAAHFGISHSEACDLFLEDGTAKHVADKIEQVIHKYEGGSQ